MIGVIISTYNGEKYIEDQLASLLRQTRQPDSVLIIDDYSSDNTVDIILNFISEHSLNWILKVNDHNIGWRKTFLSGLNIIKEQYVFFCDQDDIWEKEKIEETINCMSENHCEVLCTNYNLFYSDHNASKVLEKENKRQKNDGKLIQVKSKAKNLYIRRPGCSMCVSKKIIDKFHFYDKLDYPHDAIFWKIGLWEEKLYILNKPLLNWRRHATNASTQKTRSLISRMNSVHEEMKFVEECNPYFLTNKLFNNYKKFVLLRESFFLEPSFFKWIKLFRYKQYYVSFKSYLGDLFLCVTQKK